MNRPIFPTEKVVRGNTTKPREAEFAGRYHGDHPVYVEKEPILKHVPLLDEMGEPVRKYWNNGRSRIETVPEVQGYEEREYIIVDLGNGMTKKNYHFHPSEADLVQAKAQEEATPAKMIAFMEKVDRVFEKLGLSAEDVEELAKDESTAAATT